MFSEKVNPEQSGGTKPRVLWSEFNQDSRVAEETELDDTVIKSLFLFFRKQALLCQINLQEAFLYALF